MAVTDLTDSMPWWARGAAGGPGATGGPGAAPMGAGGQPGGGDSQAWLQYLSQMYGVSPQQAAMMMQSGGNPANMPSPNAQNVNMVDVTNAANSPTTNGFAIPPDPNANPHGDGPAPPPPPFVGNPPAPPPRPPIIASNVGGPPVGAGMLDQSGVQRGPMGVLRTQPGASAPVGAGLPDQSGVARSAAGVLTPGAPAAQPAAAPAPVPGPLAAGGAGGVGATSNPRFVQLDQGQNTDPTARNRGPQMTALNLAGLFGGQGGAVNPNAPAANAQPVSGRVKGPMAKYPGGDWDVDENGDVVPNYGMTTSKAPWNYGPRQNPAVTARMRNPRNYG